MRLWHLVWLALACLVAWAPAPARAIDPFGPPTEEDARRAVKSEIDFCFRLHPGGAQERALRALPIVFTSDAARRLDGLCWYCDLQDRRVIFNARWEDAESRHTYGGSGSIVRSADGRWQLAILKLAGGFSFTPRARSKSTAPRP